MSYKFQLTSLKKRWWWTNEQEEFKEEDQREDFVYYASEPVESDFETPLAMVVRWVVAAPLIERKIGEELRFS